MCVFAHETYNKDLYMVAAVGLKEEPSHIEKTAKINGYWV